MRKQYWLFFLFFILFGCFPSIKTEPVKNFDQRIYLHEFSFLPPKGDNWEIVRFPLGNQGIVKSKEWGRIKIKHLWFQKKILGKNQSSGEEEIWNIRAKRGEFVIMKFDNNDDLKEFANTIYTMDADKSGHAVLESDMSFEKINDMNCVRHNGILEGGLLIDSKPTVITRFVQGYACVHPNHPNRLISVQANQAVIKGRTPTNIQNELDHFLNSLEVIK